MENKAAYIPGLGWRRDTKHRATRRHHSHDYRGVGTYEVTLVVEGRRPLFGRIEGSTRGDGEKPHLVPSELGRMVLEEELLKMHEHFPMVEVWQVCLMPDHIHMIVRIKSELPEGKYLGNVIGAFKGGVSRAWWKMPAADAAGTGDRSALFEEGFNDRILMRDGQLDNWRRYLNDNPWRYLFRREHPEYMKRVHCLTIDGIRYGAFGNLLLLRYPDKHQVFFHRHTNGVPTEETAWWKQEHDRLVSVAEGGDVLVTPGISECEKRIKNEALRLYLRLIHLQTEPIGPYWKPERSRFEACVHGSLLILAPWHEDLPAFGSDYQRFHYLNRLCETICSIGAGTRLSLSSPEPAAAVPVPVPAPVSAASAADPTPNPRQP